MFQGINHSERVDKDGGKIVQDSLEIQKVMEIVQKALICKNLEWEEHMCNHERTKQPYEQQAFLCSVD